MLLKISLALHWPRSLFMLQSTTQVFSRYDALSLPTNERTELGRTQAYCLHTSPLQMGHPHNSQISWDFLNMVLN